MIPIFMAFEADAPEGASAKGSQYLSRRDFKVIMSVLVVLMVAMIPIYQQILKQRNFLVCINNMKSISESTRLYAVDFDEKLPPTYFPDEQGNPVLEQGYPITWASIIQNKMKSINDFKCPSSDPQENAKSIQASGQVPIESSYGMYAAMGMKFLPSISSPDNTILFTESINGGAFDSKNPKPFIDAKGDPQKYDGFLLGYDSGNVPDTNTIATAAYITRLAIKFPDKQATGRHLDKKGFEIINVIMVGGGASPMNPKDFRLTRRSKSNNDISGLWSNR